MKLAFPTGFRGLGSSLTSGLGSSPGDERKQKILLGFGYTLFFIFCFMLSAYFTFPYERLRDIVIQRFSSEPADPGGAKTTVQIEKLSPHWLTGIALEGVTIELTEPGSDPTTFEVDEITLNVAPIALLLGTVKVSYGAAVGEGSLEGTYESDKDGKARHVIAELDALDLAKMGVGAFVGLPVGGKGTGTIDLDLTEEASASAGAIDLQIEELTLGDGKAKVKIPGMAGGLTVDTLNAGALDFKVTIKEGVAAIEKLEAKGSDIELDGSGSVRLAYPLSRSRADVTLGFKVLDAYKKRSDRNAMQVDMLTGNPLIKRATGSDGMARLQLSGVVNALRPRPAAPTSAAAKARKPKSSKAKKGKESKEDKEAAEPEAAEAPAGETEDEAP